MVLPAAIQKVTFTVGVPNDFLGTTVSTTVSVKPTHSLTWSATGDPLVAFTNTITAAPNVPLSFDLPAVNQAGFLNSKGEAFTMWAYVITGRWTSADGQSIEFSKSVQPLVGQTTVDLDMVPDGTISLPVTAPYQQVTSLDGMVGAINGAQLVNSAGVKGELSATYVGPGVGHIVSDAKVDGTDQTAVIRAELLALSNAGGGVYHLPVGTVRVDGQIVMPHDNSTNWKQAPIRIVGGGHRQDGQWAGLETALGGSVLDLRYSGVDAKIVTLGRGLLQIEGVTFADLGASTTPFILTTNTTLKMSDCSFVGNPSKSGATCDQDAIILGGTVAAAGNLVTSAFQGYGSRFDGLRFSRIRRGFYARVWCNSVVFNNNVWDITCGGATAMEFDGTVGMCEGNTGTGNLIEMVYYTYGMTFRNAIGNSFHGTAFWDAVAGKAVLITGSAPGNEFLGCYKDGLADLAVDNNGNRYLLTHKGKVYSAMTVGAAGGLVPQVIIEHNTSGKLTVDHESLVRDSGDLQIYAGATAGSLVQISRGDFRVVGGAAQFYPTTATGAPQAVLFDTTRGKLTLDHESLVRDAGALRFYAGTGAADIVEISRGTLRLSVKATTARPSASAVGVGATLFDSTLGKPIWSDGTVWKDAAGTTV